MLWRGRSPCRIPEEEAEVTRLGVCVLGLLCLAATGCASVGRPGDTLPSEGAGSRAPATPASPATTGRASWYGEAHQGRRRRAAKRTTWPS